MTTHYTATVGITTPSVTLTDFTAVVPGDLGVNVYGGATAADINTFDIGPTGDSNILLQTLAVGGHHVHDGVCHDSHTPTGPSYGVHGIYDKAFGSLIENIEFYNHPAGQGYSARYGNTCKSCIFHDTPYAIALFNYQGAARGAAGTLQIRDCVFYNIDPAGYIFFSDGDWKESNGTLLGASLISVEIDHCTIDIRGIADPFNFSDCHNDVYLTNCVVISDSGLPLSSIIVAPTDGSTVHLDGSIVLSSADAATYLGPAPTFTPIAVGGSPVIGTAVASPPGVFTQFGNEGDLGASQTGSTPPGPPPLPGPSVGNVPTPLGQIGIVTDDSGSVTSLSLVVTETIPPDPNTTVVFFIISSPGTAFPGAGEEMGDLMVDDQPDPGGTGQPGNAYGVGGLSSGGQFIYALGFPRTIIEPNLGIFGDVGPGAAVIAVGCIPYWGLTAGTTITITFVDPCGYGAAVGYAYSNTSTALSAEFNSGTINPTNTEAGNLNPGPPLSDVVFSELAPIGLINWQLLGIVATDAANGDISDLGGDWAAADGDTSATDSLVWVTFLADGSAVDQADAICDFTTSIAGTAILDGRIGFLVMSVPYAAPTPPSSGAPVFNNHIRLSE